MTCCSQSELSISASDQSEAIKRLASCECGDNKYVYSPGDEADRDNNDMINERDINICDNDQTRDGVSTGLMTTFTQDNDITHKLIIHKLMEMTYN